ncbi:MAG TPA: hypothetical protein VGW12_19720 [Pyrinomonadaceae bacterium]|nr:hypothetical protein [Pyrinomonadaceae bacterium]
MQQYFTDETELIDACNAVGRARRARRTATKGALVFIESHRRL